MVKIKQKKTMNLPQLIEWGFKNDITNKEFFCDGFKEKSVIFNLMGWAEFSDELSYNPQDTFTVEVEENVTENTEFKTLIEVTEIQNVFTHINTSINEIEHDTVVEIHALINGRLNLIWTCEKGLVE